METKVCRNCAEDIKAAARLCPFCQSSQSRNYIGKDNVATVQGCVLGSPMGFQPSTGAFPTQ